MNKYVARRHTELNAYMTLYDDDKTIGLSDGVGYMGTLSANEVRELYLILKNVFEEEEEPRPRRHRTQGEFDDWPSNAQMEYFKRGGR